MSMIDVAYQPPVDPNWIDREERVAILIHDGGLTVEQALRLINTKGWEEFEKRLVEVGGR